MNILTAEQVRECVEDLYWEGYNDGYVHRGHGIEETDWQAITDELNSRTERTCKWELEHSGTLYDKWRCSKCGYLFVEPRCDQGYTDFEPNYCPNCGCKVVG